MQAEELIDEFNSPDEMIEGVCRKLEEYKSVNYLCAQVVKMLDQARDERTQIVKEQDKLIKQYVVAAAKVNKTEEENRNLERINSDRRAKEKELKECDFNYYGGILYDFKKKLTCRDIAVEEALIQEDSDLSVRNVASTRMAELLGLNGKDGNLIVNSELTDITVNGEVMQGVAMDEAEGDILGVVVRKAGRKKKVKYSANAFRELLNLQIFDIIMGQVDRNHGNYICQTQENKEDSTVEITHITGIDNDMCGGLLTYDDIYSTGKKGKKRIRNIEIDGKLQVPAMDYDLAMRIKVITPEIIHYLFCDIFSYDERLAIIDRIKGIQNVIKKLEEEDRKNLVKAENKSKIKNKGKAGDKIKLENKGKAEYKSKFIRRNDVAKWQTALDDYGEEVRPLIQEDREKALALMEKHIGTQYNLIGQPDLFQDNSKVKDISAEIEKEKNKTINAVASVTYLHADFLFS